MIGPLVDTLYPPRCLACGELTEAVRGLCGPCWRETHFISGPTCGKCGVPIEGETAALGRGGSEAFEDICDPCRRHPPAWDSGAAAVLYGGAARKIVLAFKHGDRLDMRDTLAGWMAPAGRVLLDRADVIAPVPLHWRRLLRRRYNQSAELARALSRRTGKPLRVDLLARGRFAEPQERMNREARARNQTGAFAVAARHRHRIEGRSVLLVDDVLTTGATLSACAEALHAAGAGRVDVLVFARVAFAETSDI